ncbi:MAG: DNA cytosine methyltransferase, partial [Tepidiformaceae bacterium]
MNSDGTLTFIDLFAGCGGLSLGLVKAGFQHVMAVEKSPMAAETYYHNFIRRLPDTVRAGDIAPPWAEYLAKPLAAQAATGLIVNELAAVLEEPGLLSELRERDIDLVAGGPPCQGFSMAGRRNPDDIRNQLPWQFLRFVEAVRPKAVIIENVVGIGQDFVKNGAKAPFGQLRLALEETEPGYVAQPMRLNAMHFGVPEHRPRMLIVAVRKDVAERIGMLTGLPLWRSDHPDCSSPLTPVPFAASTLTVDDAIWDLTDSGYIGPCCSDRYARSEGAYAHTMRCDPTWFPPAAPEALPPAHPANHVLRKHSAGISRRFQVYQ